MRSKVSMRTMMAMALAGCALVAVPAHAGKNMAFTMKQSDDRFSSGGGTTWSSEGNRISMKSIAGGVHIDRKGVFLNPSVTIDARTGEVKALALIFVNVADRMSGIGSPNAIGRPLKLSFITGEGAPIVLPIRSGQQTYGEPSCYAMSCKKLILEDGIAPIDLDDYRRLLAATALAIRIDGTERTHVYEAADISPGLIANLRTFDEAHLAGAR